VHALCGLAPGQMRAGFAGNVASSCKQLLQLLHSWPRFGACHAESVEPAAHADLMFLAPQSVWHRDLKSSNVLLSMESGRRVIKVTIPLQVQSLHATSLHA